MSNRTTLDVPSMPLQHEFEELFREHSQMLYRTAYSLLDNGADAEDVLQTIFLRLLRGGLPRDFERSPKGYLYRSAVNLSLDMIRARKRRQLAAELQHFEGHAETESVEEIHRRLAEALAELDPEATQILLLKYVHSYKDADIARVLGTSRGAIAMRLLRSRSRLKQLLRSLEEKR